MNIKANEVCKLYGTSDQQPHTNYFTGIKVFIQELYSLKVA